MRRFIGAALVAMAVGAVGGTVGGTTALAAAQDFAFEAVPEKVKAGSDAVVGVRLINRKTGKAVENPVIFQSRLDMSPEGMGEMASPLTPMPADKPGVFRFRTDLSMAGRWSLKLQVKVPGEPETVRGEVIVVATE